MNIILVFLITINVKILYKPMFDSDFFIYRIGEKISFKPRTYRVKSLIIEHKNKIEINETLRRIRETGIFTEIEYEYRGDTLILKMRPLFSLAVFLNFEGGGGLTQKGMGIWEHNFLGLLWDVRINYIWGYEYPYLSFSSYYPSIFKNHDLNVFYINSEFSRIKYISVNPFFSPSIKHRFNFYYLDKNIKKFLYERGKISDTFEFKSKIYEINISRNFFDFPYILAPFLGFGEKYFYYDNNTYVSSGIEAGILKTGVSRFIENFGEKEFLTEGLYLKGTLYKNINNNKKGFEIYSSFSRFTEKLNTIFVIQYKNFIDKFLNTNFSSYLKITDFLTFALLFKYEKIWHKENDFSFEYLGGISGLRGYPAFYFRTSEYLLNIAELRIYLPEILHLIKPGFVLFIDNSFLVDVNEKPFSYGFGLRCEMTRSYDLPVVRIDFGFSEKGFYISFGEGQSF